LHRLQPPVLTEERRRILSSRPDPQGDAARPAGHVRFEGVHKQALETGRNRLVVTSALFVIAFLVIGGRLADLSLFNGGRASEPRIAQSAESGHARADIVDRNGVLLATTLPTASLYANPRHILDAEEAVAKLISVLPELDPAPIRARLQSDRTFVWLYRNLTPKQQFAVNALGVPGLYFQTTDQRVYPHGSTAAHVLGLTDVDGRGIAGIEGHFDKSLSGGAAALRLSLDLRVQSVLRAALSAAIAEFSAAGAAGLIMDAVTGEVRAMVSLPDFDPNRPGTMSGDAGFNRVTKGVYEMGSTFKLFTAAMALDSGAARLTDRFDATHPIRVARFTISDYHARNRWLTVPEILIHSSNIGAAKMAEEVGTETQRKYLDRFGMLRPASIELPEVGSPLTPHPWRPINTMTISYGHGIAVSPMQLATGVAALVNGGILIKPTLLAKREEVIEPVGESVLNPKTSEKMRQLMRAVVRDGTGGKADVVGYRIGGKTGTAEKTGGRGYGRDGVMSSFVGAFPTDAPKFVVLVMVDQPTGTKASYGYATGGWVAAPAVGRVVARIAPILGMRPETTVESLPRPGDALYVAAKSDDGGGSRSGAAR
jgi:cell division protein FtsI (penicillin-binding protein 3)